MIRGIGTDIVKVNRFECLDESFLSRIFTGTEIEEAKRRQKPAEFYASRFAAKEAFSKALGTGFRSFSPVDVEVVEDNLGKPSFRLHGNAKLFSSELPVFLSISHEDEYAIAMVVIE